MWMAGLVERMEGQRAYSETCRLHGLDNFLTAFQPLLCGKDSSENPEGSTSASHPFRVSSPLVHSESNDDFELPAVNY